jgi:hypothetical protein
MAWFLVRCRRADRRVGVYEERVRDVRIFYNPKDRDRGTGRTAPDLIAYLTQTAKPAGTV